MGIEQTLKPNTQETIITNESVPEVVSVEVISEEEKLAKVELKAQKEKENNEQIEKVKEDILKQFGGQESKQEFPEGHIMNPKMLDKIAQLEAIDTDTLEFSQARYDDYISKQTQLGAYSVGENQEVIQSNIDAGKKVERGYSKTETIYGQGGWNRYAISPMDGLVTLSRGSSNTTGSPEYKAKLAAKAKELGIKVEGQE